MDPQYFIEDGVHRAVAARENGLLMIPAVVQQKLLVILQRCFHELRNLAPTVTSQQVHDLADAVEILPALMLRWEEGNLEITRAALGVYQSKYAGAYDYLSILNMDDAAFRSMFLEYAESWALVDSKGDQLIPTASPT